MKKILFLIVLLLGACNQKKIDNNLEITGNIEGLKSGTLYIQRLVDTALVAIDTIKINGDSHFISNIELKTPEMLYLFLDRGVTNSLDNNLPFFAEPGKIKIDTDLDFYYAKAKITGSKNHELYEEYLKINKQFNSKALELTQSKFIAIKTKNQEKFDSIQTQQDNIVRRKYLYTVNFAINNKNFEIAPFITLSEISDVNLKYLDTIQKSMSPKVAQSLYGKKLIKFYNQRLKVEKIK